MMGVRVWGREDRFGVAWLGVRDAAGKGAIW
jgi:hypothetical protein